MTLLKIGLCTAAAAFLTSCAWPGGPLADDRLLIDAKINGKPVNLAFDTGMSLPVLFRPAAEKLGLHYTNEHPNEAVPPGKVRAIWAEESKVTLWGKTINATFAILETPAGIQPGVDGVIGWPAIRSNIVQFDCSDFGYEFQRRLPRDVYRWSSYRLNTNLQVLAFDASGPSGGNAVIVIDTGSTDGVSLSPELWQQFVAVHPNRQKTICEYFMPGTGLVAQEESWADEVSIGNFTLSNVPVREANISERTFGGAEFCASIGIYALKGLNMVVDGKKGVVYIKPANSHAGPYDHNRLGAAFLPKDSEEVNDLIAHVLEGSPAYEAGIRDGDILVKMGNLAAAKWWTENWAPSGKHYHRPKPGTKIELTLKRGEKEFKTEVVLRDLIGPNVPSPK